MSWVSLPVSLYTESGDGVQSSTSSRAEWDGCSDGLPLSPRYESRLEGVSFT